MAITCIVVAGYTAAAPASTALHWTRAVDVSGTHRPYDFADTSEYWTSAIGVDAEGNATALWSYDVQGHDIVRVATKPYGGSWSEPEPISADWRTTNEYAVALAVDPRGDAVAAWQSVDDGQTVNGRLAIEVATRVAGHPWRPAQTLATQATDDDPGGPQVAIDANGDAFVTWAYRSGAEVSIQSARHPAGREWTKPVDISATVSARPDKAGGQYSPPTIAVNAAGAAVAAWALRRGDGHGYAVQSAMLAAGAEHWQHASDLATVDYPQGPDATAIDSRGNATVVWSGTERHGMQSIDAATYATGSARWSSPVTISHSRNEARDAVVAVDRAGYTTVAWDSSSVTTTALRAVVRPPGGVFGRPVIVSAKWADFAIAPQIATDPGGSTYLVWTSFKFIVGAVRSTARGRWHAPVKIGYMGDGGDPMIASGLSGNAAVLWYHVGFLDNQIDGADYPAD